MVNYCWVILRNYHTNIDNFFHSVSLPYCWCLMMVWTILNSSLLVELGNKYFNFLLSRMRRVMSYPSSTIRSGLWPFPSSFSYIKAFRMHPQYSLIISPFQGNIAADSSCIMKSTVWSWVEKILQEHQRRSLLKSLRFQSTLKSGWSCTDIKQYECNQTSQISVILIKLRPYPEKLMTMSEPHGRWMWYRRKLGKMNINNKVSIHSNHSGLVPWISVWVCGVMDTIPPPFYIDYI